MFLHVTRADYIKDHSVRVWFNDGSQGDVNLSSSLDWPIFEPFADPAYFRTFSLVGHTLSWPNGADFRAGVPSVINARCGRKFGGRVKICRLIVSGK